MSNSQNQSPISKTARNIAYGMIGIYGGMLVIIGIVAAIKSGEESQMWVELLKSGFLLLGGGLTTIIGYYFGSRGVQEAQDVAEKAREELERQKAEFAAFKQDFVPTDDEDALIPEGEEVPEA